MKNINTAILGIITLLLVVFISGCTSQNVNPKEDIILFGGNQIEGSWNNAEEDEWLFNGNVYSKSKTKYGSVILGFTAYDSSGNIVGTENITVDMSKGMGYFQVVMKVNGTPDRINMTIINATKI